MAEGVDLYGLYNKVTDWPAVRAAGIEYAWVKLSDGNTNREDYGYVSAGHGVGIAMGGYHYAQPGDPVTQANRLIDRCEAYGALDLAPALDLEAPFVPGAAAVDFAVRFLQQINRRGHRPCLYANNSMLNGVLASVRAAVPGLKVWGARYGANLTVPHDVHQYTSTGRVPGITGDVDRNRGAILRNTAPQKGDDDMDLKTPVFTNTAGKEIPLGDVLGQDHDNLWTLRKNMDVQNATLAAMAAAIGALSNDPDITKEEAERILREAVTEGLKGTVTVQIGAVES